MPSQIGRNNGEIIIYRSEDGKIRMDVRLEEKTVWLTQERLMQEIDVTTKRCYNVITS